MHRAEYGNNCDSKEKGGPLQRKDTDWKWRRSRRRSWRGFG